MQDDATTRAPPVIAQMREYGMRLDPHTVEHVGYYDTRTHAAIPREPSEADVSRIASVLFMCGPDMTYRDQARAAIAALVQTQGGERDAPP